MAMCDMLDTRDFILTEAAVIEALGHSTAVGLHPLLENALLIYDTAGQEALASLHQGYIDVARQGGVPIALGTPTWRANQQRIGASGFNGDVNGDAVRFMKRLRKRQSTWSRNILIGGLIGCKNDCYRPDEGLDPVTARTFHAWQIERLVRAGPDFLMAATLPSLDEAAGIARAMAGFQLPYIISFVIDRRGHVLDGSSLADAIGRIDAQGPAPPLGYMVNCAYPAFLRAAEQPSSIFDRLVGFQANASSLDHSQLDQAATPIADTLSDWGDRMVALNKDYGLKILGGCCGTRGSHLRYLVNHINKDEALRSGDGGGASVYKDCR